MARSPGPISLDTNVLVRLLVEDDPEQCAAVITLLDTWEEADQPVHVPLTVVLEVEWVLRSRYLRGPADIARAFGQLLSLSVLSIENEPALEAALHLLRRHPSAQFADCLHIACARSLDSTLVTLDERAARLPGAIHVDSAFNPPAPESR